MGGVIANYIDSLERFVGLLCKIFDNDGWVSRLDIAADVVGGLRGQHQPAEYIRQIRAVRRAPCITKL